MSYFLKFIFLDAVASSIGFAKYCRSVTLFTFVLQREVGTLAVSQLMVIIIK